MLRYLFLVVFYLSSSSGLTAATVPKVKPKAVLHMDSSTIKPRYFNHTALNNYSNQQEFKYNGSYVGESLWQRFWRWFWGLFANKARKQAVSIFFKCLEYFLIALGAVGIIFLILKLIGVDALNIIKGYAVSALPYDEIAENIYAIDFDAEIENAKTLQNYRLAVRLLYLKCLKQLSDAGLIKWDINKTNNSYLNELTHAEQRMAFNILTRQFEYVWYGEFIIDAQAFAKISARFNDFKIKPA